MDGLLFDTERTAIKIIARRSFELGFHLPYQAYIDSSGRKQSDCLRITREYAGEGYPYDDIWSYTSAQMNKIISSGNMGLKSGAKSLLYFLKKRQIPLTLVTSSSYTKAKKLLKSVNLDSFFDNLITGELVDNGKPNSEIYLYALEVVGQKASECLVLEDSESGVISALGANIPTIIVPDLIKPNKNLRERAVAVLTSLDEVEKLLMSKVGL